MSKVIVSKNVVRIPIGKFDIKAKCICQGWMRMIFKFNDISIDFNADTTFSSPLAELVHAILDLEDYKDSDNETQVVFEDSLEKLTFDFCWDSDYEDVRLKVTREYGETVDDNHVIHPASQAEWDFIINFGCLKIEVLVLCVDLLKTYGLLGVNSYMGRDSFPLDGMLRLCHKHINIIEKGDSKHSDFYEDIKLLKKLVSMIDESDDWCRRKYQKLKI